MNEVATTEFTEQQNGWALELTGKPMSQLSRWEQRQIIKFRMSDATALRQHVDEVFKLTELGVAEQNYRALADLEELRDSRKKLEQDLADLRANPEKQSEYEDGEGDEGYEGRSTREHVTYTEDGKKQFRKNQNGTKKLIGSLQMQIHKMSQIENDILTKIQERAKSAVVPQDKPVRKLYEVESVAGELADLQD
jgi:hypothetical protein